MGVVASERLRREGSKVNGPRRPLRRVTSAMLGFIKILYRSSTVHFLQRGYVILNNVVRLHISVTYSVRLLFIEISLIRLLRLSDSFNSTNL